MTLHAVEIEARSIGVVGHNLILIVTRETGESIAGAAARMTGGTILACAAMILRELVCPFLVPPTRIVAPRATRRDMMIFRNGVTPSAMLVDARVIHRHRVPVLAGHMAIAALPVQDEMPLGFDVSMAGIARGKIGMVHLRGLESCSGHMTIAALHARKMIGGGAFAMTPDTIGEAAVIELHKLEADTGTGVAVTALSLKMPRRPVAQMARQTILAADMRRTDRAGYRLSGHELNGTRRHRWQ